MSCIENQSGMNPGHVSHELSPACVSLAATPGGKGETRGSLGFNLSHEKKKNNSDTFHAKSCFFLNRDSYNGSL